MIEKTYSHREALAYVCWLLRSHTYQALLIAGQTWQEADRKAQQWNLVGNAGTLFTVKDELERCLDTEGNLIAALEFAWKGEPHVICRLMENMQFHVTIPDLPNAASWLRLTVQAET